MYYSVRAEDPKSIENVIKDDNETFDILSLYLKGLNNARVRTILKSKIDDLELETLCDQTRNLCDAYGDGEEHVINFVQNTNEMNRKISDLSEKLENISINHVKNRSSNNFYRSGKNSLKRNRFNNKIFKFKRNGPTQRFSGSCNHCGIVGHKISDCRKGKILNIAEGVNLSDTSSSKAVVVRNHGSPGGVSIVIYWVTDPIMISTE